MKNSLPLPDDKKLCVTYHVERGCLGLDGKDHIDEFEGHLGDRLAELIDDFLSH